MPRPLPNAPSTSASDVKSAWSAPSTPLTFVVNFSVPPSSPRLLKARRRDCHIFPHSASSSTTSLESVSTRNEGIQSAEFWISPSDPPSDASPGHVTPQTRPKPLRPKPADIIIPHKSAPPAILSPETPAALSTAIEHHMRSPLSPLSPFLPQSPVQSPNARIRKIAKLKRTLGENVPIELVFPDHRQAQTPRNVEAAMANGAKQPRKRRLALFRNREPAPASTEAEWPLTPTPDWVVDAEAHAKTAVGLHYALGMDSFPRRSAALPPSTAEGPASPGPFSAMFNIDDASWERARQAVMGSRRQQKKNLAVPVLDKAPPRSGLGVWRKKENTWSGEWNVENMEELHVRLRRLK